MFVLVDHDSEFVKSIDDLAEDLFVDVVWGDCFDYDFLADLRSFR